MTNLTVCDIGIKQDEDGRYCLNDLHKASGGDKKHGPSYWLANLQTMKLIVELSSDTGIPVSVVNTIKGGNNQGTYVCKELVYSYAMWISASFNLKVIRAYDTMVTNVAIPNFKNPAEAARAWAKEYEDRLLAEAKVEKLEVVLSQTTEYYDVTRVMKANPDCTEKANSIWRPLKKFCEATGLEMKPVFCARFGKVNAYPRNAWEEVYPSLVLPDEAGELI